MTHRTVLRSAFALAATLLLSVTAQAQIFRAYLSSEGLDTNACTLPAPCRLLPAALTAVANGGEIWMLDSANYNTGQVNIAKSVTILAVPGALGSVVECVGGVEWTRGRGRRSRCRARRLSPPRLHCSKTRRRQQKCFRPLSSRQCRQ